MNKTMPKYIFWGFIVSLCIMAIIGILFYSNLKNFIGSGKWQMQIIAAAGIMLLLLAFVIIGIMVLLKKELAAHEKTHEFLQESLNYSNMIIDTVPNPLLVLDEGLNIISGSRSFFRHFNYRKEEIENKSFFEVLKWKYDYQELRKLLCDIITDNKIVENYELELAENRIISINARKLYRSFNNVHQILVGMEDITVRKKAEEERNRLFLELDQERQWLNSILSQMPSGVSIAEAPSGKLIYHNELAVKLLGHPMLPAEDYRGYNVYGALHDLETPYLQEEYPIARALFGEVVYGEEMLYLRGDGTITYFSVNAAPLRDKEGNIKAAISTFQDISQNKNVVKALMESEEMFSAVFHTNPDAVVISRVEDGTILDVNESFLLLFGWKREEVIGKSSLSLEMIANPEDRKIAINLLRQNGRIRNHQIRIKNREGKEGFALLSAEMLQLSQGNAFLTTIRDITEQKQAENELKESRNNLLDAQKLARLGNYTIDIKNNNKIEWSDELYEIWELDKSKPIPPFEELWGMIHPDDKDQLYKALNEKKEDGDRLETEFRVVFPDGRVKYIQIITRLDFDESGNLSKRRGVEIDVTGRKIAQIELEKTLEELERSNNELEQFAYMASHDLQEPLRMVSNYLKLLQQKYESRLDDKAKQYIDFAVDGAKRLSSLVKGLLSYSRITTQGKEPEPVDLNHLLSLILRDLKILIDESKAIIDICQLPVIKADDIQMRQLFQNLIMNAIKFKNDKKVPKIKISADIRGNEWFFSVEDNGIGIAPEYYDRIFIIFQRLHERDKYPGTGLGLAVCKKIVERHGGRIWVESEEGTGTTFYFTIPK